MFKREILPFTFNLHKTLQSWDIFAEKNYLNNFSILTLLGTHAQIILKLR